MSSQQKVPLQWRTAAVMGVLTLVGQLLAPALAAAGDRSSRTRTPIKHVIVIIAENRTFDHVFATYQPKRGETVKNLLSEGIINEDGTPGPKYFLAEQSSATDTNDDGFQLSPGGKATYQILPAPFTDGAPSSASDTIPPPFATVAAAKKYEYGLEDSWYKYLTTGASGLPGGATVDTRILNAATLPPGPFQITSSTMPYDSYAASPVHRFYQMWQQFDCSADQAKRRNPSGCTADLFPWVEVTIGAGSNGKPPSLPTHEGGTAMGFYNMAQGDVPYLKSLADRYAISDNYHQAVMGGTGANHVMLGTGDAIWFSDSNGNPAVPPHNQLVAAGSKNAGVVDEIENPNAQPGTNNWYTQDGYGGGSYGSASYGGGTYSNCADTSQPGVAAIVNYLKSLKRPINPNCEPGHYYLLNNYNPGYYGDGRNAYADITNPNQTVFTIPPSTVRNIGDEMIEKKISWNYYGEQWNTYKANPDLNYVALDNTYCNICNPFQYSSSIMTKASGRGHLKDTLDFYQDIQNGTLPAVSFVKPDGYLDGHPASSKLNLFEGFLKKIVDMVEANRELWKSTAIIVTFDEGGGYYDSGYIQPLDFFGDGTRIPLLVISPYSRGGHVSHVYSDHVSVLKFIEANWRLRPVTGRSRDNMPNPKTSPGNPYVPLNSPAIGDLMDLFNFERD